MKKGDVEMNKLVLLIIAAVVLVICILLIVYFKDVLWDKFDYLKGVLN